MEYQCLSATGLRMLKQIHVSEERSPEFPWRVPKNILMCKSVMSHEPASPPSATYSGLGFGDIASSEPAPGLHRWEY